MVRQAQTEPLAGLHILEPLLLITFLLLAVDMARLAQRGQILQAVVGAEELEEVVQLHLLLLPLAESHLLHIGAVHPTQII